MEKVKNVATKAGATIEVFHVGKKITQFANEQQEINLSQTFEEGLQGTNYYYKNVYTFYYNTQKKMKQMIYKIKLYLTSYF